MGGDHLVYAGQIDELIDIAYSHKLVSSDHHIFSMSEVDNSSQLRTAYVGFRHHAAAAVRLPGCRRHAHLSLLQHGAGHAGCQLGYPDGLRG